MTGPTTAQPPQTARLRAALPRVGAAANAAPAPVAGPVDRVSFFVEQRRRRRQSWTYGLVCLGVATGLGVVVAAFLSPLVLLAAGGFLELAARLGVAPERLAATAHAIGHWAATQSALIGAVIDGIDKAKGWPQYRALIARALPIAQVFLPGMAATALLWLWIRRLERRSGMEDLALALEARPPRDDHEERQLGNLVAEMAIAAGLPTPRLLVVDAPAANAAAIGNSHRGATILVTRGLLDRFDRAETEAIVAQLMGAVGNGDLGLVQSLTAIFATLAFLHTLLDLSFRVSAWPAMARFLGAAFGWGTAPSRLFAALTGLEPSLDLNTSFTLAAKPFKDFAATRVGRPLQRISMVFKVVAFPYMLILLVIGMQKFALSIWSLFFLRWPVGLIWRMRRYLADSTAIQLTRDPGALSRALKRLAEEGGLPPGGERRDYLFVQVPHRRTAEDRPESIASDLLPSLANRLRRIDAQGASVAGATPAWWRQMPRGPMLALIAVLVLIVAPLTLVAAVIMLFLVSFAIELGLLGGLDLVSAVLGA